MNRGARAEVVVTGVGTVNAFGTECAATVEAAAPAVAEIDRSAGYHNERSATLAAPVGAIRFQEWIPAMVVRRMSRPSRFAVTAAKLALADAGVEVSAEPDPSLGVTLATSFGPSAYTQRLIDQVLNDGPHTASPALFTECVANAPAGQVAIHCRARGANVTLCGHEAGALAAVARAASRLRLRREARVLAGNVEELTPLLHASLDRFGALATSAAGVAEAARPFDRRRNGILLAEGATVVLLESAEEAAARSARALARVLDWQSAFDPTASPAGWGTGVEGFATALGEMLSRNGIEPGDVDRIVSGASGSVAGDRLEALTLRRVWGERALPPVLAPKGVTGEYGGGFLAAAIHAVGRANCGPTAGFGQPDPELGIVPHDGTPLGVPNLVLVSSLATGGGASWMLLQKAAS